jgi:hypothetical protein
MPILFFNTIFILLIFPLKGRLLHKILIATIGNMAGLGWEYFSTCLAVNAFHYLGDWSGAIYFVINPFLELFWIVFLWSLGLSVLASAASTINR